MKRIFTLLAFVLVACTAAFSQATVTLECYSCEELSGRYCASCQDSEMNYFKGLLVRTPQGAFEINSPFSVLVRGSSVRLTDWQGDIVAFARRDTPYRSMDELMAVINGCNCQGGGSLTPGSVDTDELADGAVEWDKLSGSVQDSIQAGGGGDGTNYEVIADTIYRQWKDTLSNGSIRLLQGVFNTADDIEGYVFSHPDSTGLVNRCASCDDSRVAAIASEKLLDLRSLDNSDTTALQVKPEGLYLVGNNYDTDNTDTLYWGLVNGRMLLVNEASLPSGGGSAAPAVSSPSVSSSTSINFQSYDRGIFDLDFSGISNGVTLALSNPYNGGEYIFWVNGCTSDTITFPDNFLSAEGDSLKSRACDKDKYIEFFYDGTNYITPDTFWTSATPGGSFSPGNLASLVAWYDASQETEYSDAAGVDTLHDWSGNGYHLGQSTSGSQATYETGELNSLPVFRMDGTDDFYDRTALTELVSGSDFAVFAVATITVGPDSVGILLSTSDRSLTGSDRFAFPYDARITTKRQAVFDTDVSVYNLDATNAVTVGAFAIRGVTTNGAITSSTAYEGTTAVDTIDWDGDYDNLKLTIGDQHDATQPFNGDWAEIIILSENPSAGTISDIVSYLQTKYGL